MTKGAKLRASVARNKKPLLALGAGVVVVLALWARKKNAGDTPDSGVSGDGVYAAGSTSTPSYYTAGSGTYDSSITDLYNAMQKQIEAVAGLIPVKDPYEPANDKGRPLSAADQVWDDFSKPGMFVRLESDGSVTPISKETWSAYRLSDGAKHKVQSATGTFLERLTATTKNAVL